MVGLGRGGHRGGRGGSCPSFSCPQNASAGVERLLIGNKCDMEGKRKVQRDEAEKVGGGTGGLGGTAGLEEGGTGGWGGPPGTPVQGGSLFVPAAGEGARDPLL